MASGAEYNFTTFPPADPDSLPNDFPGTSAFALEDGGLPHLYSSYARGGDVLWGMFQWLDHAPKGRNENTEDPPWFRLHDEYEGEAT